MTRNLSLQSLRTVSDRTMKVKLTVDKITEDEVDLRYFAPVYAYYMKCCKYPFLSFVKYDNQLRGQIDIGQIHRSNIMAKNFDFDIKSVTCFSICNREIFHETSQQRH